MRSGLAGYPSNKRMSTDPKREPDEDDDLELGLPEGGDPLVDRLRRLHWPRADDETRERALEQFRRLMADRDEPEPGSAAD